MGPGNPFRNVRRWKRGTCRVWHGQQEQEQGEGLMWSICRGRGERGEGRGERKGGAEGEQGKADYSVAFLPPSLT